MTIKTLLGNKGKKSKLVGFTFSTAPVLILEISDEFKLLPLGMFSIRKAETSSGEW